MGRLINYGLGEVLDRLTILDLKILAAGDAGQPIDHWRNEQAVLLTQVQTRLLLGTTAWIELGLRLAMINGLLWHAEDDLRACRNLPLDVAITESSSRIAFRIQDLNDRRSQLITQINQLTGEHLGPEKV